MGKILVIGAGFGGLSAAAELSRRGHQVTVLEAHVYPGGSAGTFYHKGYRFDAGATLAGGFAPGAVMDRIGQHLDIDWQASLSSNGMRVHLKDGLAINSWTDSEQWIAERISHFGMEAEPFWEWQESTADLLWNFALRLPYWPPQSAFEIYSLANHFAAWQKSTFNLHQPARTASIVKDAFRKVHAHIPPSEDLLRQFVDAQLLISAQTTSGNANALYGSAALDLTRQGVAHIPGGMGGMAGKLVDAIRKNGGEVHFREEVLSVLRNQENQFVATTKGKNEFISDVIICNLPPWNIAQLMPDSLPQRWRRLPDVLSSGWGAFMLYIGLEDASIDEDLPLHHQVVVDEPLGEANSIFLSLSPSWDESRAPAGKRAVTISTHTNLEAWWQLFSSDREAYDARKSKYVEKVLSAAGRVLKGIKSGAELVMPGTPVTFQRFTRRHKGWVGGFPQTSLFRSRTPRIAKGVWMVGDSVFPGQSVPAVMLSGLRVAQALEHYELHAAQGKKNFGHGQFNGILEAR
jgi:C-3',4' desaturase CrtD